MTTESNLASVRQTQLKTRLPCCATSR